MKLIKYLLWVLLLMMSLVFLVKLNELNQFDGNPLTIKIPFLVDIPAYENGFKVWIVLVMTLTSGVIIGFTVLIDHRKVGLDISAFITVVSESSSHYNDVVRQANKTSEIVQCFTTTGNGSHVLLAITKNTISLEKLLRIIQSWPGVMRTETQMVLSSYKSINALPIP